MKFEMRRSKQLPNAYECGAHTSDAGCPWFATITQEEDGSFHLHDSLFIAPPFPNDAYFPTLSDAKKAAANLARAYFKHTKQPKE